MVVRPMFWLLGVFFIALFPNIMVGERVYWEAANALGFVAFAGLLILLANGYSKSGFSHFHRWFGIATFIAMIIHSVWFLIKDKAVLEYVLPGAPVYMVLGLSALLISVLITASSFKRPSRAGYINPNAFRFWHNWQAILVVILSALHIVLSGFYFKSVWQLVLFAMLSIFSFILPAPATSARKGARRQSFLNLLVLLSLCFVLMFVFLVIRVSTLWGQ